MALPDPLSLTLDGVKTPPKIIDDGLKSIYVSPDGKLSLTVSHQLSSGKRRTVVRLDETRVASDPLTAVQKSMVGSTYIVFDTPLWGFDVTSKVAQMTALNKVLSDTTNALAIRILSGEH